MSKKELAIDAIQELPDAVSIDQIADPVEVQASIRHENRIVMPL